MKPLWTQIPLPKVTDIEVAKYYVARGWVDKIEDIYVELTDKQKLYLQTFKHYLLKRFISEMNTIYQSVWTKLPVSRQIMTARDYYRIKHV